MDSITVMPEVLYAMNNKASRHMLDGLQRSCDVFRQINPEGDEYKAVLLLKAQTLSELNLYQDCVKDLDVILKLLENDKEIFQIKLARSKMNWLQGRFVEALEDANAISDIAPDVNFYNVPLYQGIALNSLGLCEMAILGFKDIDLLILNGDAIEPPIAQMKDAGEAAGTFKMASSVLRNAYTRSKQENDQQIVPLGLATATSYINQGVAEIMNVLIKSQCIKSYVSCDHAMQAWRDALNILDEIAKLDAALSEKQKLLMKIIQVQAYSNMAWTLLFSSSYVSKDTKSLKESTLKTASEYAGSALKIASALVDDNIDNIAVQNALGRSLSLVASCYARAGSAVTAEGLLQTAMEKLKQDLNPMYSLNARSAHISYFKLCSNWEKRNADADKSKIKALDLDQSLGKWKGASSIYSGYSFITIDQLS
jgi:tetratricopeptide (TPR) repeat protein